MTDNPLRKLQEFGQGVWLDFISRGLILSGDLASLISEDGVTGVTSNPAIFEKSIGETSDYDGAIAELARHGKNAVEIYEELAVDDIQATADLLRPVYDRFDGKDGFVSLEVSPHLAHDSAGTILEARRLWQKVSRPNVMIKVPGTWEGLSAIRELTSEGINVNVTLLFGIPRYRAVAEAYLDGLSERLSRNLPLEGIASVASFFLSRIDVKIDPLLETLAEGDEPVAQLAGSITGELAIASARIANELYREILAGERFLTLAEKGARPQRVLWASTSTKNPAYRDTRYIESLIGPDTVNTMPLETLKAYRDHGYPALRLGQGVDRAHEVMAQLAEVGIDINAMTQQLEDEGVDKFIRPFDRLMETLERKRVAALG